jgi:hypothetical protein
MVATEEEVTNACIEMARNGKMYLTQPEHYQVTTSGSEDEDVRTRAWGREDTSSAPRNGPPTGSGVGTSGANRRAPASAPGITPGCASGGAPSQSGDGGEGARNTIQEQSEPQATSESDGAPASTETGPHTESNSQVAFNPSETPTTVEEFCQTKKFLRSDWAALLESDFAEWDVIATYENNQEGYTQFLNEVEEAGGAKIKGVSARVLVAEAHTRRRNTAQSAADTVEEDGPVTEEPEPSRSTISSGRKRGRAGSKPLQKLQEEGKAEWDKKIRLKCLDSLKNLGVELSEDEGISACKKEHWTLYAETACTLSARRRVCPRHSEIFQHT